jgi:hypothetical protein
MSIKKINLNFVFQLSAILSLTIVYIFQWGVMISSPSLRTGTDFMAFYSAGRIAQGYGFDKVYDVSLQKEIQEELVGFPIVQEQVLIFIHPPFILPILALIVSKNYAFSFFIWVAFMFTLYAIACSIFIKVTLPAEKRNFLLAGSILFFPFFQSLLLGQDTAILILGVALWYKGLTQKNDWLGAIGIAVTSIRPHLCLFFLIASVFLNHKTAWKYIFTTSLLAVFSIVFIGKDGTFELIRILQISASGEGYGTNENSMVNLIGLVLKIAPGWGKESVRMLGWIGYIVAMLFTIFISLKKDKKTEWLISITILLSLFFAPHLHYHDVTLLIVPLIFLCAKHILKSNFLLAISLILLVLQPLFYILPYVLYAMLTCYFLRIMRHKDNWEYK